jgi:Rieske 2Fe-2S family protein
MARSATAPLRSQDLAMVLRPFGRSFTLPGEAYTAPDVFDWEAEAFFEGGWVCAGRAADVAEPGAMRAVSIGTESILLVRDEARRLHAFFNVCRHRGHQLLDEGAAAAARAIRCPYHAWVYGLDGSLRGAPRFLDRPGFDRSHYPLIGARVAEWHGWIFVNVSGDAEPFEDYVGNLGDHIAAHEPERLVAAVRHHYVIAANWKIVTENYHECYHCPQIHPELCRVTPVDSGYGMQPTGAWAGGSMELMEHAETMSITGASGGVVMRGLDERLRREVLYLGLFPNLLISLHPDYVMTHRLEALGVGQSRIECEWLFPPEALEAEGFDPSYASEFWDLTNKQDWAACESVQRGVASRGYRQGPLATAEDEVYGFVTMVARGYLGEPLRPKTGAETPSRQAI